MKIFISWSGERSKAFAEMFRAWISCVIQNAAPWISSQDMDRGTLWFNEISEQLKECTMGIVCLTPENLEKPWLLFEAGALFKGLPDRRVFTFLIDVAHRDVGPPLSAFNHTTNNKEDVFSLIRTINSFQSTNALNSETLNRVFDKYWDDFDIEYQRILNIPHDGKAAAPRDKDDVLGEVLNIVRGLQSQASRIFLDPLEELNDFPPKWTAVLDSIEKRYGSLISAFARSAMMCGDPNEVCSLLKHAHSSSDAAEILKSYISKHQ